MSIVPAKLAMDIVCGDEGARVGEMSGGGYHATGAKEFVTVRSGVSESLALSTVSGGIGVPGRNGGNRSSDLVESVKLGLPEEVSRAIEAFTEKGGGGSSVLSKKFSGAKNNPGRICKNDRGSAVDGKLIGAIGGESFSEITKVPVCMFKAAPES